MTHDGVREATKRAIAVAKESGAVISFDPNLRPPLWNSLEDAKVQVAYGLGQCDVLKISDNEIQWFTGCLLYTSDPHTKSMMQLLMREIWVKEHPTVVFITHDIDEAVFLADKIYVTVSYTHLLIKIIKENH